MTATSQIQVGSRVRYCFSYLSSCVEPKQFKTLSSLKGTVVEIDRDAATAIVQWDNSESSPILIDHLKRLAS